MIEFIKHFLDQELNKEERSILSAAYKNVVSIKLLIQIFRWVIKEQN